MPARQQRKPSASCEADNNDQVTLRSIDEKLNLILTRLDVMNSRIDVLEHAKKELEKSLEFLHSDLADTKAKLDAHIKSKTESTLSNEDVRNLTKRLETNEHRSRAKCLELNGIPYNQGENLYEALDNIIKHLKLQLFSSGVDIDSVYRLKQSKRVIVKFTQTDKRNKFFQHYRKNIVDISALGFRESGKIYVNEVLSKDQSNLFWKARTFKTTHKFKYAWTFNQKIYLRRDSDSDAVCVNSEEDLEGISLTSDAVED